MFHRGQCRVATPGGWRSVEGRFQSRSSQALAELAPCGGTLPDQRRRPSFSGLGHRRARRSPGAVGTGPQLKRAAPPWPSGSCCRMRAVFSDPNQLPPLDAACANQRDEGPSQGPQSRRCWPRCSQRVHGLLAGSRGENENPGRCRCPGYWTALAVGHGRTRPGSGPGRDSMPPLSAQADRQRRWPTGWTVPGRSAFPGHGARHLGLALGRTPARFAAADEPNFRWPASMLPADPAPEPTCNARTALDPQAEACRIADGTFLTPRSTFAERAGVSTPAVHPAV